VVKIHRKMGQSVADTERYKAQCVDLKEDHGDLGGVLAESDCGDIYGGFIVI
jgi:hypothetical protein